MDQEPNKHIERMFGRWGIMLIRAVIALNFLRFGLSFSPWFEGTVDSVGESDRLFGGYRLGGFRIDFVWLVASTLVIFSATFYFLMVSKRDHRARVDAFLCAGWTVAFVVYIARVLLTGILYFG
jgi:NADH:ubiquinone oxidoreductase subunit H